MYHEFKYICSAVGPAPSPFDCYLALRGARTLHLRMRQHQANSLLVRPDMSIENLSSSSR